MTKMQDSRQREPAFFMVPSPQCREIHMEQFCCFFTGDETLIVIHYRTDIIPAGGLVFCFNSHGNQVACHFLYQSIQVCSAHHNQLVA